MTGPFQVNAPPPSEDPLTVANDGFFPDIDALAFRSATRQDKSVTDARVTAALTYAVLSANRQLSSWKAAQLAAGESALAEIDSPEIAGTSVLVHHYLRAVYSFAKAELIERYADYDATGAGLRRDEEKGDMGAEYRRDAAWALSDLQGRPRSTVELI